MFRGGSYLDQPKFSDFNVPLRNSLDISVTFFGDLTRILKEHNQNQIPLC